MGVTISRGTDKLSIDIYKAPTYTDIIPNDSCHPNEQKLAAIRYFYNRMNTYQLSAENKRKESNKLQQILLNNGYSASVSKIITGKIGKERDVN